MNLTGSEIASRTNKTGAAQPLGDLCFIETQFPVSKMSMESYKERKANYSQTLTGLGKWWGRKPLVLCRAAILGLLLPATDDPQMDREVFLRLMTMDEEVAAVSGVRNRCERRATNSAISRDSRRLSMARAS